MGAYSKLAQLGTLVFGAVLAYAVLNPLGALVYILIWLDVFVLARILLAQNFGFEFLTLAAIISGISLGPVAGFAFTLIAMPILIMLLTGIAYSTFIPTTPNVTFIAMALAAAFAGLLAPAFAILPVVFVAVLFRHFVHTLFNMKIKFGVMWWTSAINSIFTTGFIFFIGQIGVLSVFV